MCICCDVVSCRYGPPGSHEGLVEGLLVEGRLRLRIAELQAHRAAGRRTMAEVRFSAIRNNKKSMMYAGLCCAVWPLQVRGGGAGLCAAFQPLERQCPACCAVLCCVPVLERVGMHVHKSVAAHRGAAGAPGSGAAQHG